MHAKEGTPVEFFYRLQRGVTVRHVRILLLVLAVILMAVGCGDGGGGGDDGGGGY
jgi:hypothetical protein